MNELELLIPSGEFWDPIKEEFIYTKETLLRLKHSLISVAKWECKYKRSFFNDRKDTIDEHRSYIKCMTLNGKFDDIIYDAISISQINDVARYIDDPMTASTYHDYSGRRNMPRRFGKIVTAESFYSAMVALGIPFECEKWHLNRLLALIRFCEVEHTPGKKMSEAEVLRQYSQLNAARRAKLGTKG